MRLGRLGERASRERTAYGIGWGSVLATYAGRFSVAMVVFGLLARIITLYLTITGRLEAEIDKAGGRIPASPR